MQHISTTSFGRRTLSAGDFSARAMADAPLPALRRDKWAIHRDLTMARGAFGIGDRDLAALLSFHPHDDLGQGHNPVVFPSNAKLMARAHGIAESTLRRRLAALVKAGLILRRDSPNGKRYARLGAGGDFTVAYGFDLRPLLLRAAEIQSAAQAAHELAEKRRALREAIVLMLRDATALISYARKDGISDWSEHETVLLDLRRALRRKLPLDALTKLHLQTKRIFATIEARARPSRTKETRGSDTQNERHIQDSYKQLSESECPENVAAPTERPEVELTPRLVLAACPDAENYTQEPIGDWGGLLRCASFVRPMLGIADDLWQAALEVLGPAGAATTLLAILQGASRIRRPGAYLRNLVGRARDGDFSPGPMIMALLSARAAT